VSNLVLGYLNAVVLGSVAASSYVGGLGPDQLQNDQGNAASALQIPATSGTITVTWTGLYHGFGLFRTNLSTGATVTWTVKNGSSTVATGTSLAVAAGYQQSVYVLSAPVSGTSLVVSISDAGNPDGHLNIPLMFAGPLFQPARNMSWQSSSTRTQQTTKALTRSGGVVIRTDWVKRSYDLNFAGIKEAELTAIGAIDLAGRQGNNLFFVPDPQSLTINLDALFGEFEPQTGITYPYSYRDARGWRATITERL
jgi:hypothetical protein